MLFTLKIGGNNEKNNTDVFYILIVKNSMMFFADYADFKREAKVSRELFESTLDMDPHKIIDKRDIFGK